MAYYRSVGDVPPKRHTQHRDPGGRLYREELMGEEGFSSDSSLLYHRGIPSAMVDARDWPLPPQQTTPNHPLRPRHLRLHDLVDADAAAVADPILGRRMILSNADVSIHYSVATQASPLYRSSIGDEMTYVEAGAARVETVFGLIDAVAGDYVLIPRFTTHRWIPTGAEPLRSYVFEAGSHIVPPQRYLSRFGQLLEHAPYCERDLHGPTAPVLTDDLGLDPDAAVDVHMKHRGSTGTVGTIMTVPHHPFDVVGWDGFLYPWRFSVHDYEPITGRIHQPPPTHQVFGGTNFVICNFVPRKVDYHPLSVKVPYYHANVDSDEIMFYVGGDYEARKGSGIDLGSVSVHPGGHPHGPQPGAVEATLDVDHFDELAVMIDTFRPLELGEGALACEDPEYAWTWAGGRREQARPLP